MTTPLKIISLAAALAVALLTGQTAMAQQPAAPAGKDAPAATVAPHFPIAVLDMAQVRHNSSAGKAADQQLTSLRAKYKQEIAKSEEGLRSEYEQLSKQRSLLSPEAFEEKGRAFERKQQDAQRLLQSRNAAMESALRDAEEKIGKVTLQIVTEIMNERGISLVIDQSQMVASVTRIEITGEVLKRLDKALPTVKVVVHEQSEKASKAKK